MPKVYAIIRGNGDILVGSGGRSGRQQRERTGLHLPGGTMNRGESPTTAAIREAREETGIDLLAQDVVNAFFLTLNGQQVHFVVFEVSSVADAIRARSIPHATNPYDEPFRALHSLAFNECIDNANFSAAHHTDWFSQGLSHAYQRNML